MSDRILDAYIDGLSDDLEPVRRLWSPWVRTAAWLAAVLGAAAVLAWFSDLHDLAYRLRFVPDMWLAVLGSTLTTVLGALATFQLSLPDRSTRWALLPLPGLALWVAGTGMGCLRTWVIPETHPASLEEAHSCFVFIVGLSVPLSLLTILMVRRAFPYRPNLVAGVGGTGDLGGRRDAPQLLPSLRCGGSRLRRPPRRDQPRHRRQSRDGRTAARLQGRGRESRLRSLAGQVTGVSARTSSLGHADRNSDRDPHPRARDLCAHERRRRRVVAAYCPSMHISRPRSYHRAGPKKVFIVVFGPPQACAAERLLPGCTRHYLDDRHGSTAAPVGSAE